MTKQFDKAEAITEYRNAVADEVAAIIGRRRMNKLQIAQLLGVNHAWVARRLSGDVAFDVDDLLVLAHVLGCDLGDFLPSHPLYRSKPLPTKLRDRVEHDELSKRRAEKAKEGRGLPAALFDELPRLDSNQQPSGCTSAQVSGLAVAA